MSDQNLKNSVWVYVQQANSTQKQKLSSYFTEYNLVLLQGLTSMTMKNSFKHKETKATRTKDLRQEEVKVIILSLQKIKLKVP